MADNPISGALGYVKYGWESTFAVPATTIDKAFGHDVKINIQPRNNLIEVEDTGSRNVQKLAAGSYEGTASIEWTLGNTYWLKAVMGSAVDAGTNPTVHAYNELNTVPSMTIEVGYDMGTTDVVRKLVGCKIDSVTISSSIGEKVKVTADVFYKTEATPTSTLSAVVIDSIAPMVFCVGTVMYPDGTIIPGVQSTDLTISNGLIRVGQIGSRDARAFAEAKRTYKGNISHTFENSTAFLALFGTGKEIDITESKDMSMLFSNLQSGASSRELLIKVGSVKLDTDSIAMNPNELVLENVSFQAYKVGTITGKDNVAATP